MKLGTSTENNKETSTSVGDVTKNMVVMLMTFAAPMLVSYWQVLVVELKCTGIKTMTILDECTKTTNLI